MAKDADSINFWTLRAAIVSVSGQVEFSVQVPSPLQFFDVDAIDACSDGAGGLIAASPFYDATASGSKDLAVWKVAADGSRPWGDAPRPIVFAANDQTTALQSLAVRKLAQVKAETGLHVESDMLWVAVSDNGPGIPEDQLGRIFNVFESTKGARGTGLGLAVSLKILREHGGDIAVESRLGEGSRFTLAWPRLDDDHTLGNHARG